MIGKLLEFGKALLGSKPARILATGLVLLAMWGAFNDPTTTPWYFSTIAVVFMFLVLAIVIIKI
ncbi:MAG: hypothetical protein RTU92_02870 [Candidatus Thorarchaeota archaeon]